MATVSGSYLVGTSNSERFFYSTSFGFPSLERLSIYAGAGDDAVLTKSTSDPREAFIELGWGRDIAEGTEGSNVIFGDYQFQFAGVESGVVNLEHGDFISGRGGNDIIFAQDGPDYAEGGSGSDLIYGGTGDDFLVGNSGADQIYGGSGNDTLVGGNITNVPALYAFQTTQTHDAQGIAILQAIKTASLSSFRSESLTDTSINLLDGGDGDDTYILGDQFDRIADSSGNDTITTTISRDLGAFLSIEKLVLGSDAGNINGTGNALANALVGNGANNILNGAAGNDTINAGAGNDTLIGGLGRDKLLGGSGQDLFRFTAAADSPRGARDTIEAFSRAEHDRIDLRAIDADTDGTAGNQAFRFIGSKAFSGVDGQLRFANGVLQGDTNGDRVADVEFHVAGVTSMISGDFLL